MSPLRPEYPLLITSSSVIIDFLLGIATAQVLLVRSRRPYSREQAGRASFRLDRLEDARES